jgi:3-dehydroquinate synthase
LCTLTSRQIRSGLAEVIKYGIIRDTRLFTFLEKNYADILDMDRGSLEFIVERSAVIKATVVAQDERETKGVRTILNFGHTLGHAIEAAGCYRRYTHGEAIALGMLCACDISQRLNLVSDSTVARIENVIRKVGLPCRIHGVSLKSIINAHYRDKKFIGFTNRFVLLTGIGEVKIVKNVPLAVIKEVVMTRMPKVRH